MRIEQAVLSALFAALAVGPATPQVPPSAFVNFEGAQTNPIRISADGTRLFALNTPNASVSVFDVTQPSSPALIVEIPVGIEPVSVNINPNVPGNDEAWVVNQISNSVSIVSVSKGIVTDTLYAKAEPADVVFAGKLAFVSVARSNLVNVYNAFTHAFVKSIPLTGEEPRALAVSLDGSTVYVAFALSGNHTTIVGVTDAPPPPAPTNPNLPPAPQVGLIVDASDPTYYPSVIQYTMPDNDVAAISVSSLNVVNYFPHLGTVNLGLAVNPQSGNLYVANTDALNLTMFETNLNGHFVNHQITFVNPTTGQTQIWNLNPGIDYSQLPNPAALATTLAMPTAVVFEPTGRYLYIAAFGTDRVGIFDTTNGTVTKFIEIDPQATGAAVNAVTKRGPRGLALNSSASLLYVLNRIYNTISIVNLSNNTVTAEIPTGSFDPTPAVIRNGRGFLYDHKLSGNGTGACASCHIDAEMDLLGWNLGNPAGNMTSLLQGTETFEFHPMKGPMTTQTLRGLPNLEPYHWRGDQPDLLAFNSTFASLLGGQQLSSADMAALANFINTIAYQPNPNQNLDRTLPNSVPLPDFPGQTANPNEGQNLFLATAVGPGGLTCDSCHTSDPGPGTNLQLKLSVEPEPDMVQPMKTAQLRNLYQRTSVGFLSGDVSVNGFGFDHDGSIGGLFVFFGDRFPNFANKPLEKKAIEAYELCFDTGTAPAVGYSRTLTSATIGNSPVQNDWNTLQSQASAGNIDLIANGTIQGQIHGLLYVPASNYYQTDTTGLGPFTQTQLTGFVQNGDTLTIMGVPPGSGVRMGVDRDLDGVLNGDARRPVAKTKRK
jgi:YVTN family beta-propeller protein